MTSNKKVYGTSYLNIPTSLLYKDDWQMYVTEKSTSHLEDYQTIFVHKKIRNLWDLWLLSDLKSKAFRSKCFSYISPNGKYEIVLILQKQSSGGVL